MFWGYLLHLGYNMWSDRECDAEWKCEYVSAKPYLRFDESLYEDLLPAMVAAGINLVVLDIGEGVRFESHPEIAVTGSWTTERLQRELARMRGMGLEPIPKLNFSTAHDAWLGDYARMVSTPHYYEVCRNLIQETIALFETPRFFHLGMDEETAEHQRLYEYALVRQKDLWWRDLAFYLEQVEGAGVRPWIWSDYIWHHPQEFRQRMPKSVLQSNWYYGGNFTVAPDYTPGRELRQDDYCHAYLDMETDGYDQVPTTCTNPRWAADSNCLETVRFCRKQIAPERLLGFLQTVWRPTKEDCRDVHLTAIARIGEAIGGRL